MNRRELLRGLSYLALLPLPFTLKAEGIDTVGQGLSPWCQGSLEIHHIATGRGDCTFVIAPDGTKLLIDVGASATPLNVTTAPRPDGHLRPGEWIARYVKRRSAGLSQGLDYVMATHLHPDHIGDIFPDSPRSRFGAYRLSGITDVAEQLPITAVFDRGWPDYSYPEPQSAPFATNYIAFMQARKKAGLINGRIEAGRADQLVMTRKGAQAPSFEIRALSRDGRIWSGKDKGASDTFPPLDSLPVADRPNENMCSIALRIAYGSFRYFIGGDLTSNSFDGALPWADVEGAVAEACGPVDVAVACHHGYYDAVGARAVRALQPRIWVVTPWHSSHPDMKPLERMLGNRLYDGDRDVFLTEITQDSQNVNMRFLSQAKSLNGHIIVRIAPSGTYKVFVTDSSNENDTITYVSPPIASRLSVLR